MNKDPSKTDTPSTRVTHADAPREKWLSLYNPAFRGLLYQLIALAIVGAACYYLWLNTTTNMNARGIQAGFGFLHQQAGFDIGETLMHFTAESSYLSAIMVGFLNTLRVAIIGCVCATILGTMVGIGRLSTNFLLRSLCAAYVEVLRNVPLLVQLLAWYFVMTEILPSADHPFAFGHNIYLSKSGLQFPHPTWHPAWGYLLISFVVGMIVGLLIYLRGLKKTIETGRPHKTWFLVLIVTLVIPAIIWQLTGAPTEATIPRPDTFGLTGGGTLTPEFLTLTWGLTLYTSCYIAEVVRSGIVAVPKGQTEAPQALGLHRSQRMRLVVLPQALRVIIPPMTNQYLNLTKNSSLAVAIGYPDLVNVLTTTQNQTGQALECFVIIATIYLSLSIITSVVMNWYNARLAYRSR